jgi:hypothetical protein
MGRQHINVVQEKYIAITLDGNLIYTHGGFKRIDSVKYAEIYLFATEYNAREKLKSMLSYDGLLITKVYVSILEDNFLFLHKTFKNTLIQKVVDALDWLTKVDIPEDQTLNLLNILGDLHTELTLLQIDHEVKTINH